MTLQVDETRCIGCGLCAQMCPTIFSIDPRQLARVTGPASLETDMEKLEAVIDYCPVQAIHMKSA